MSVLYESPTYRAAMTAEADRIVKACLAREDFDPLVERMFMALLDACPPDMSPAELIVFTAALNNCCEQGLARALSTSSKADHKATARMLTDRVLHALRAAEEAQ